MALPGNLQPGNVGKTTNDTGKSSAGLLLLTSKLHNVLFLDSCVWFLNDNIYQQLHTLLSTPYICWIVSCLLCNFEAKQCCSCYGVV